MKLHVCSNCGVVVVFDVQYEKSGWLAQDNGERILKCPVCTYPIREGEENATIET